ALFPLFSFKNTPAHTDLFSVHPQYFRRELPFGSRPEDQTADHKKNKAHYCKRPVFQSLFFSFHKIQISRQRLVQRNAFAEVDITLTVDGNLYLDRKSTRLNSSHVSISYAVFCLKKKKKNRETIACIMHDSPQSL